MLLGHEALVRLVADRSSGRQKWSWDWQRRAPLIDLCGSTRTDPHLKFLLSLLPSSGLYSPCAVSLVVPFALSWAYALVHIWYSAKYTYVLPAD